MARVLVVYPPVSLARDFIDYPYFADLGAVQLAAVLRARGDEVTLVDAYALPTSTLIWRQDGRAHLGAPVADVVARFGNPDVAVVAYTPFHRPPARDDVLGELLAALRASLGERRIVLADLYQSGQHYVEAAGEAVLASYPEVDAWVKYEGEVSVPRLLDEGVPRGVVRGVEVASLDDLPAPAWDLLDLAAADQFRARLVANLGRGPWAFPIDGRTLPMVTSRGCPFRCAHCSSNPGREDGAPKTQRRLSVDAMRASLERLAHVHHATRVEVLDELLNVNERHFDAFLDIVTALDLKMDVPNGMRADYLERRHLHAMRGRVATVSVSAESGVQRVVTEVVGKQLDLREIERVAEDAHAEGIKLMIHFIIGMPRETADEVRETLAFATRLFDRFGAFPAVQFATPLPGTALARGRSLPVVADWGPHFQMAPSQPGALVEPEALVAMKKTFDAHVRAAFDAKRGPGSTTKPPRTRAIVTNMRCNQACSYCDRRRPKDDLAAIRPEALRARIDEGIEAGAVEIVFTGGEPTMRGDLEALVRHARDRGAERIALETNAVLVDDVRAVALRDAGLSLARVNLVGADDAVDAVTRDPGGFQKTRRGLEAFARAGVSLEVLAVVTRSTKGLLADLPAALASWLAAGKRVRTIEIAVPASGPDPSELLSYEEAVVVILALEKAARAAGIALRMRTGDGPPPCTFPAASRARIAHLYTFTPGSADLEGSSKLPVCATCKANDRCPGISDEYLTRRAPPPMSPIEDDRTRRRLSLISSVEDQIARELVTTSLAADDVGNPLFDTIIRVNFHCNQACAFCFVSTHLPPAEEETVRAAIVEAARRKSRVVLSGGEPTLNRRLVEYVRLAKASGAPFVSLQTNAVKLDDAALAKSLVDAGVDETFVSLHGCTAATSDAITEAPGTFVRTIVGLDHLHATGVTININFVLCEANRRELVDFVRFAGTRWPNARLNFSFVAASTDLVPRERALIPRYSDILPALGEAVAEATRLGVQMIGFESMCGLPLCLVPASIEKLALTEIPEGFDRGEFVKADACHGCRYETRCFGIRRGYVDLYGTSELRTVP
jgi:MoaA/NifB/PqqE/SkfB family radical SAM enzyme